MLIKVFRVVLLFVLSMSYMPIALSDGSDITHYGSVDGVYQQKASVVVDDTYMQMALNLKVYDHRGDKVNRYSLKKGQKIAYKATETVPPRIMEIWIKKDGFKFPKAK